MSYLFLINEAECHNSSTLDRLKRLRENNEVVVLSLNTLASLALRRMGIDYVTPNLFFAEEKSFAVDMQAGILCREWYKTISHPLLSFHGASIGEALEFDFFHLFIDALRSVEIVRELLKNPFETIFVPSWDSETFKYVDSCYYTLPSILVYLANQRGIRVVNLERSSSVLRRTLRRLPHPRQRFNFMIYNAFSVASFAMFLLENFRALTSSSLDRKKARYVMAYHYDALVESLRDENGRALRINSSRIYTPKSISQVKGILRFLKNEKTISELDGSIVYDGTPLWRMLVPLVDPILSRLVPLVIGSMQWTELVVKVIRPSSFVTLEDLLPHARSMCQVLRLLGIPVVVVQHGILTNDFEGLAVMPKAGDIQAVWGEYYRKWHIDRGKPAESQVTTGAPRFDSLFNLPPLDRDELYKRFGLDPGLKVVLIATEYFGGYSSRCTVEVEESYIRLALRSLKQYRDIQIVVKLHPQFQSRYYRMVSEIAEQEGVRVIIARDALWDLIRLSSFVIVSVSGVCLETLILGKPVISINLNGRSSESGMVQDGLATGASNEDEIKQSVSICIRDSESDECQNHSMNPLLFPFIHMADGHSTQRVAELIRAISIRNR
ncbi:MAG: CDP-glycerol glycerophosphotransferase family protein [Candidatus Thermoplasmatota archaeon]|nr:CDP-glycerol glycerophosphotransferase family protein [Candidatus Thermoplasmatota archaeon]